jgi:hypothetical protein
VAWGGAAVVWVVVAVAALARLGLRCGRNKGGEGLGLRRGRDESGDGLGNGVGYDLGSWFRKWRRDFG